MKVPAGLGSFLEALGEKLFPCLFQLVSCEPTLLRHKGTPRQWFQQGTDVTHSAFLKTHSGCCVTKELEGSREGAGKLSKKC